MKKLYEELELEIIRFGAADIITASDAAEDDTPAMDDTADDTGDDDGGITIDGVTYYPTGVINGEGDPEYKDDAGNLYGYIEEKGIMLPYA